MGLSWPVFRTLRKRRALRDYARRLPALLRRDYGPAPSYSPAQIRRTIDRYGLDTAYSCFALSGFSDQAQFDAYHSGTGENCDYHAMRGEFHDHASSSGTFFGDIWSALTGTPVEGAHHGATSFEIGHGHSDGGLDGLSGGDSLGGDGGSGGGGF
jgi:hypothetical protein